ncbi:MAG: cytochrome c3 family protein [Desulfosalsimonadaceae bacterium]
MKQYHKVFSLLAVFAFAGLVFFAMSTEAQFSITTVEDSAFSGKERMRPIVSFDHDAHMAYDAVDDCNTCHHMWEDGKKMDNADSIGMECSACHLAEPGASEMDLISAYHRQCRTCHLNEKAGPILCGECHAGEK